MASAAISAARTYLRVAFEVPAAMVDDAAGVLIAEGALGCEVAGDNRSAGRRKALELQAYFKRLSRARLVAIQHAMAAAGMLTRPGRTPSLATVADPGWATAWKDRFAPLPVGRRLLIVPPWNAAVATQRLKLVINPGQAFGTGHHATTYGALRTLEQLCAKRNFARALDVGTGSGVLAIAMRLMGVAEVCAIDIDAVALINARENAALNSLAGKIRFATTPLARLSRGFDLVVANILSSTLSAMVDTLTRLLAHRGVLVLGGILESEAAAVLARYAPRLRFAGGRRDRGWSTLVLAR